MADSPKREPQVNSPLLDENREPTYKPYDKKTRIKAWIGVVAMIALTLGYFYVFYSGRIIGW